MNSTTTHHETLPAYPLSDGDTISRDAAHELMSDLGTYGESHTHVVEIEDSPTAEMWEVESRDEWVSSEKEEARLVAVPVE